MICTLNFLSEGAPCPAKACPRECHMRNVTEKCMDSKFIDSLFSDPAQKTKALNIAEQLGNGHGKSGSIFMAPAKESVI